jgi:sulfur-oxidizing protein SoxZ
MAVPRPRVKVPRNARKGEVVLVRTLLRHRMETGLRTDDDGNLIPRHIINEFVCRYDDAVVFSMELHPAVSSSPYIEFYVLARRSGTLEFFWYEDGGKVYTAQRQLTVS